MNLELYKHGLSNALDDIKEALENDLNTNNKNEKTKYIGEAYGIVKALDMLIIVDETDETEDDN